MSRSLVKNSVFNVAYKLLNVLFPLVTTTYVARVLLAEGVGKVAYAQNIVTYFVVLAALGIPNYGIREIAKVRDNLEQTNKVFSELMAINFVSTSFFLIAYVGMILSFPFFHDNVYLHVAVGGALVFKFIDIDWFYQGREEFAFITIRSFFVKVLFLIWIFLFVKNVNDVVMFALASVLGIGANNIFNVLHLKKTGVKFSLEKSNLKKHLKPIFVLFASVIAIELYTMVDTTMIGIICGNSAVGLYANAIKIVRILIGVISGVSGVLLPRLSYHYARSELDKCSQLVSKALMVMIFLYIPCQIGLLMEGDVVMPFLFGESFAEGGKTLQIASLLICTLGFSNLFGTQVLLTFGQEKKLFLCTVIAAVTNLSLNFILIPKFEQNGAAAASVFAELIVTIMAFCFCRKYIAFFVEKKFVLISILSTLLLVGSIYSIKYFVSGNFVILLCSAVIGGALYMACNVLLKNPILDIFYSLVKRKK